MESRPPRAVEGDAIVAAQRTDVALVDRSRGARLEVTLPGSAQFGVGVGIGGGTRC